MRNGHRITAKPARPLDFVNQGLIASTRIMKNSKTAPALNVSMLSLLAMLLPLICLSPLYGFGVAIFQIGDAFF